MNYEQSRKLFRQIRVDVYRALEPLIGDESFPEKELSSNVIRAMIDLEKSENRIKPETFLKRFNPLFSMASELLQHIKVYQSAHVESKCDPEQTIESKREEISDESQLKKETEIKGEQQQVSTRGGTRQGAGRKSKGIKKTVAINLPSEHWTDIDNLIQNGKYASYADFFRSATLSLLSK